MYRNGTKIATTGSSATSYTYTALTCNTTYTVGLVAFDAAGNRSGQATVQAPTQTCSTTPTRDATAPSSPDNQRLVGATQTSLTMGWSASTDNVGVTGYDVYRNGTKIATTGSSATSYTYTALTCNTTYTVGLVAFDAAGNRSNLAEATGPMSTSACSTASATGDTTAPTAPSGLSVNNSTATSIGLNWKAATDNVGVTGYGVYRNGSRVSTVNSLTSTVGTLLMRHGVLARRGRR